MWGKQKTPLLLNVYKQKLDIFLFIYFLYYSMELIVIIVGGFMLWITIGILFPDVFKKRCANCGKKHVQSKEYEDTRIGNSIIFGSSQCFDEWHKRHSICEICHKWERHTEHTIQHKFKRQYFYFCSSEHKEQFRKSNPDLFFEGHKRHSIPSDIRKIVFKRDNGKCVKCGSDKEIQYDHIIPVSKGGATSVENIEILCQDCNRSKSDKIE